LEISGSRRVDEGLGLVKIKPPATIIVVGLHDLSGNHRAKGLAAGANFAVGLLRPEKRQAQLV
jgi:hypothetical protein